MQSTMTAKATTAKATTAKATTAQGTLAQGTPAPSHTTPTGAYVVIQGNAKQIEDLFLGLTPYQGDGDITVFAGPDSSPLIDGSNTPQGIMALFLAEPVPVTAGICQKLAADYPDLHIMRCMAGEVDALVWHNGTVGLQTLDAPPLDVQGQRTDTSYKLNKNEMYLLTLLWETIERHRRCGPEGQAFADRLACRMARLGPKAQGLFFRAMTRHGLKHEHSFMETPLDDVQVD